MDNNNNFDGDYTVADKEETTIISSVGISVLEMILVLHTADESKV
jgi:hypothetical protein